MSGEDDVVAHGGSIKAPKILADIVESIAAAIYVDVDFDLQRLWVVCSELNSLPLGYSVRFLVLWIMDTRRCG